MHLLVQTIVLGLLTGGIYALIAAGLSLVFGVLRVVNFAHGAMAMLGAFAAYFATANTGVPALLGIPVAILAGGAVGYATNALLLRPVHQGKLQHPGEYVVIATFVLMQLILGAAIVGFGGTYRHSAGFWDSNLRISDWVAVSGNRVVAFVAAIGLLAGLLWAVYHTDLGRAWRALTQNRLGAQVSGLDVGRLSGYAFAAGAGLAAAGLTLMTPLFFVYPGSGSIVLMKGFVVVIVAGLGSIGGVLVGGLALGVVEALGTTYISSAYTDAYGFLIMIAIMMIYPLGIFGRSTRAL